MTAHRQHVTRWGREDKPTPWTVVKVWYCNREIHAVWTGKQWRTPEGDLLREAITHWYPK
jgi:hypothetical protein